MPAVAKREPRILYLSVSGFGQTGPLAGRPAMDPVLQAFTGLMMDNKGEDGIPHRVPFVVIDMSTALFAFQALSAALYARRDLPQGRHIAVSLLEAASAMQVIRMMMVYLEGQQVRRSMPSGVFKTADGWLQFLIVRQQQWLSLCGVLEMPQLAADPRFIDEEARMRNEVELMAIVRPAIAEKPTATWSERLSKADIMHERLNSFREFLSPAAGGGDRSDRLAEARRGARADPRAQYCRHRKVRGRHAARHHAGARPAHRRHPARPWLQAGRDRGPRRAQGCRYLESAPPPPMTKATPSSCRGGRAVRPRLGPAIVPEARFADADWHRLPGQVAGRTGWG